MTLSRTKRVIWILLGIILLGVLGYVAYRRLLPTPAATEESGQVITGRPLPSPATPQTLEPGGSAGPAPLPDLPSISEERLVRLTDFPVVAPALNKDETRVLFYKKSGGDLFASDFSGKKLEKQSNLTIIGLIEAVWQKGGGRAVVRYTDGDTIKSFLQIGTSTIAMLPQGITSAVWSPDGALLAYTRPGEDRLELAITDVSGKNPRAVFQTPLMDASIAWITADIVIFSTAPSSAADGYFFAWSGRDSSFTKIFGPERGLTGLWSPDGTTALISSGRDLALTLYDRAKRESAALSLATLAEKCVWADTATIFCAIPQDVPPGTVLPDAYLRGEFNPSDRIVMIDARTRAVSPVFDEGEFDMASILATKDKKRLFFVNRRDGTLWTLSIR